MGTQGQGSHTLETALHLQVRVAHLPLVDMQPQPQPHLPTASAGVEVTTLVATLRVEVATTVPQTMVPHLQREAPWVMVGPAGMT
jgi:hypothetical protein